MNAFVQNHIPLDIHNEIVLRISIQNSELYLHTNSLDCVIDKWKRIANVSELIKQTDKSLEMDAIYNITNQGTWIHFKLWKSFGDWWGKNNDQPDFGTFLTRKVPELVSSYTDDDYFRSFLYKGQKHILRMNKDTNFVNLTDILRIYGKDIRTWKKTNAYKDYAEENPSHILSGNDSVDEFGVRCSYGHPEIAMLLLEWLHKNVKNEMLYGIVEEFISGWEFSDSESFVDVDSEEEIEEIEEIDIEVSGELCLNGTVIQARTSDGYINSTQICKAAGKKFSHWSSLDSTKELINVLSSNAGIPALDLVHTQIGGDHSGSWVHPDLAVQLAQWCSPVFAIQVSRWIRELIITGSVEVNTKKTDKELVKLANHPFVDLRPYKDTDVLYIVSFEPTAEVDIPDGSFCYKFGVAQDAHARINQHDSDKAFSYVNVANVFKCSSRSEASVLEKHTKRFVNSMGLSLKYSGKKECFFASPEEYETIKESIIECIEKKPELTIPTIPTIPVTSDVKILDLFEAGRITFEQVLQFMERL
jgi:predicted GIY-YIG superfamily endonuclease